MFASILLRFRCLEIPNMALENTQIRTQNDPRSPLKVDIENEPQKSVPEDIPAGPHSLLRRNPAEAETPAKAPSELAFAPAAECVSSDQTVVAGAHAMLARPCL